MLLLTHCTKVTKFRSFAVKDAGSIDSQYPARIKCSCSGTDNPYRKEGGTVPETTSVLNIYKWIRIHVCAADRPALAARGKAALTAGALPAN